MVQLDFTVSKKQILSNGYGLLKLKALIELPQIHPGQFLQIKVDNSPNTFLRRPISICNVEQGEIWILIRDAGDGTHHLLQLAEGESLNIMLPLGHGFMIPESVDNFQPLLVGGGVGVAPLLYYGKVLKSIGISPKFLLAAKTKNQLLLLDEFTKYGTVSISTDDGSYGEKGLVTENSIFASDTYNYIACCGPMPMMKAVSNIAVTRNINCEVSLENLMGCGIGACLCCVEDTIDSGNVCVCKEGPVFNINRLKWQI